MPTEHVCPFCNTTFWGGAARKFCSMTCRNKAPGRMTEVSRAKIGAAHSGDNAPMRKPGVAAKARATNLARGNYDGRRRASFKGEWIFTDAHGNQRVICWLTPEERITYSRRTPYIRRAHLVWLRSHPGDAIKRGEIIHHKNCDSLDDRPENLEKLPGHRAHALVHLAMGGGFTATNQRRQREKPADTPCETCGKPKRPYRRFCSVACIGKGQSGANNPNYGHRHSKAVREAQRARATGRKASQETREKMRQAHLARWAARKAAAST